MQKRNTQPSSKRLSVIGLLYLVLLLTALCLTVVLSQQTQELHQRAAGNTFFASPGDNLMQRVSSLRPGDTLILKDGTYYMTNTTPGLQVQGVFGTAAAPITIKAANDGKAIIDGQNRTKGNYEPIFINNASYIEIQGVVARNSHGNVVYVYGGGVLGGADHITLQRITAYNAGDGNYHVFNISFGASNVLVEDCAAWGRGRYDFIAYQANNVTFRRTFAYWESYTSFSAPRAPYAVYGSSNVTLENVIGTNAIPTQSDDNYYTSTWITSSTSNWISNNTRVLGSLFYNNWNGFWVNDDVGVNTLFKDDYFETPQRSSMYTTKPQGEGLRWNYNPNGGSISNSTFVNNVIGYNRLGSASPSLTNSVFVNNRTALAGDTRHSYLDFYGNGNNGASLNSSDKQVNPGYDTATYGKGAYLFVPQNSPLKGAGENGADMGANILYEYMNGILTNQPLWPWPMEDRIMAETGMSVTWEANGGIWRTLKGVYPNMTVTPILRHLSTSSPS